MVREGFAGQRLVRLPRDVVARGLGQAVTSKVMVTDVGSFPRARGHAIERLRGSAASVLLMCTAGDGWLRADGIGERRLSAGDVVYLPARRQHAYGADDGDPWSLHWMHVTGDDVPALMEEFGSHPTVRHVGRSNMPIGLVDRVIETLSADLRDSSLRASAGAAWHLLALLSASPSTDRSRGASIDEVAELLRSSPTARVSIHDLAAMCGFSVSHFQAKFTETVGVPALSYHQTMRMALARRLLDETDDTVQNIARATGYDDPAYFSRQFSRMHGSSPRDYRTETKG